MADCLPFKDDAAYDLGGLGSMHPEIQSDFMARAPAIARMLSIGIVAAMQQLKGRLLPPTQDNPRAGNRAGTQ